ncbi:helicase-like protein [Strigomonas culicis]|uniref:Helicase-like protein n=2 Tax=Strigomonas culicis TaxID=28005 RepID=S9U4B4_9TRYP|nr:helicase-like protein [Strigomonas culicis]|eukprot:EPY23604.1 helicase-like protein [Strigomonas culicis]
MTTDFLMIRGFLANNPHGVVLSTYHSSPLLKELQVFSFIIFDECHRVCGSSEVTAFNTILLQPPQFNEKRLFLTATPTYDTPLKMSNEALFGSIAYRYYLREGIDAGYVNPFTVRIVLGPSLDDMNLYFFEAMRIVDKMLVFCRNIKHAEELYDNMVKAKLPADVDAFTVLVAHSRMGGTHVLQALRQFTESARAILFNVRLFQEGVEIPDLNAVFFAAPRYSARDIIQSICRPLNKVPHKPKSFVFLPAVFDPTVAEDDPINLKNFSTLVPFTDALMDEDPKLFEYMIDPDKVDYDFSVVGVRSMRLSSNQIRDFVLPAVRRGVRYSTQNVDRLHRAARMPWKPIFSEVRRIVLECNRYPKTNDAWVVGNNSISLNLFYRYIRKGYEAYMNGDHSYLQVYQVRDLESLPKWKQYGLHGPYPWRECMQTLEDYLARFGRVPPLDIHKGGYIGLDATPLERLCGCLMHVNQSDARGALTLAPSKQVDMDRISSTYGLKWRKLRTKSGKLRKGQRTFMTDSYTQFKSLVRDVKSNPAFQKYLDIHFPGYPHKHERMESLQVLSDGKVPPRHLPRRRRGRKRGSTAKDSEPVVKRGRGRPRKGVPQQRQQQQLQEDSTQAEAKELKQTVMCRVCRVYVPVSKYQDHLLSTTHRRNQAALS